MLTLALGCVTVFGALWLGTVTGAATTSPTPAPTFHAIGGATSLPGPSEGVPPRASSSVAAADPGTTGPAALGCATPSTAPLRAAGSAARAAGSAASARVVATSTTRPVAAFLGDSYTSGFNGVGLGRAGWPAIVSASIGLRSVNRAVPGTGFVNPGWTGQPIRTRVSDVIRASPRVVFLVGGHNDRRFGASPTGAAADAVIDRLHAGLPLATLVIIGPIWPDGSAPASLRVLRDHLRRKAGAVGAIFIDPIRDGWFAGAAHRLIGPDGIHPTNAGHRRIAAVVLRAIRASSRSVAPGVGASATPSASPAPSVASPALASPLPAAAAAFTPGSPTPWSCVP